MALINTDSDLTIEKLKDDVQLYSFPKDWDVIGIPPSMDDIFKSPKNAWTYGSYIMLFNKTQSVMVPAIDYGDHKIGYDIIDPKTRKKKHVIIQEDFPSKRFILNVPAFVPKTRSKLGKIGRGIIWIFFGKRMPKPIAVNLFFAHISGEITIDPSLEPNSPEVLRRYELALQSVKLFGKNASINAIMEDLQEEKDFWDKMGGMVMMLGLSFLFLLFMYAQGG